jgi:hypothetical protein
MSSLVRERERAARGPVVPPSAVIAFVLVAVVVALYLIGSLGSGSKSSTTAGTRPHIHKRPHHARRALAPAAPKPTTVQLQLVPTGTVYVCLVDGAGKQLIPGRIFTAGETIPTQTAPKMLLTLGNASIRMKVNGVAVAVNPSPTSIGFTLVPSGHSSLPPSQQPRCT